VGVSSSRPYQPIACLPRDRLPPIGVQPEGRSRGRAARSALYEPPLGVGWALASPSREARAASGRGAARRGPAEAAPRLIPAEPLWSSPRAP